MRLERIIRAVYCEPWVIDARTHWAIRRLLESKLAGTLNAPSAKSSRGASKEGKIAVIPIHGVIGKRIGDIERACADVADVMDISGEIAAAIESDSDGIFLDVDSPGGTIGGVTELAQEIRAAAQQKPVMAYADGQMASAAYWIASGASAIYATPSAEVGSIGVYLPWIDESEAFAMEGLKADPIISSGSKFKAAGFPGTSLTDEQRAMLQERVDQTFQMFKSDVLGNRRAIIPDAMLGQTFIGQAARTVGLVDGIGTRREAMEELLKLCNQRKK